MERLSIDEVIEHCNKTCDMTEKIAKARGHELQSIESKQFWEHYQVREWLKELKKYKDAEEQGLLLRLPCKVGDTVYFVDFNENEYDEAIVESIEFGRNGFLINSDCEIGTYLGAEYLFLTKEEAEQALAKMNENDL